MRKRPQGTGGNALVTADAIVFEHVHVTYPGAATEALNDICLRVPSGQHLCILGGNGSGKSTLLQLVNVLTIPTAGRAVIHGMDTSDPCRTLAIRSRTASVFQHPEDQMVTSVVADDVAFGPENLCTPQPEIAKRVDAALAAVDMDERSQSDPADLSGGQMQRVAIAGALAMKPEILLLDEPCAMLDAEGRSSVRGIIAELSARGITILHVTHFMEDALAADRVLVLDHGRTAFDGTPSELFSQPKLVESLGLEVPSAWSVSAERSGEAGAHGGAEGHGRPSNQQRAVAATRADSAAEPIDKPSVVFDHVSFSYAKAVNPRKRTRRRRLFGVRGSSDASRSSVPLALDSLSFQARPGTITALIGRTGSGKSTTAELACALKLPTRGTVRIEGIDTADLARRGELRRSVGYVAQLPERQLFAETVFDDVAFGPRNLGVPSDEIDRRVCDSLRSVNLEPTESLLQASPFALSGGQQRSVAIAGVLAMGQPILVLDEPMAGLDPAGRKHIRRLLKQLKQDGTTLIMVTHSMEDVTELADQVIELDRGRRIDHAEVSRHGTTR